jgi:hypothetical protein
VLPKLLGDPGKSTSSAGTRGAEISRGYTQQLRTA